MHILSSWENFYVIIGSASAALIGLMFVVITLIASTQQARSNITFSAFGTPNVIHFCASLLIAALLSAPWQTLWPISLLLALCGLAGAAYIVVTFQRIRHQDTYQPVLEDWIWHIILPFAAYTALLLASIALSTGGAQLALFIIAAVTTVFLFIGIHNAWDTVTYTTLVRTLPPQDDSPTRTA